MLAKCMEKGHKYRKFDDVSLFCEQCGERRVIIAEPIRVYPDTFVYPSWWGVTPYQSPYRWIVTSSSDSNDITTSVGPIPPVKST